MPGASAALAGRLLVVKDNIDVAGWPTRAASPALSAEPVTTTAPAVQRLLNAGVRVLGKANMHELAFGITSRNAAFGSVGNPRIPGASAGGSSGGCAAAVAAGMAPMALGTDTGGSVRIPAAMCGVVGFRPTTGRYSPAGVVPLAASRDTIGPMAASVRTIRALDRVLADPDRCQGYQARPALGIPRGFLTEDLDPQVRLAWDRALTRIADAGWSLVEVPTDGLIELIDATSPLITAHELRRDFNGALLSRSQAKSVSAFIELVASPDVRGLFETILHPEAPPTNAAYARANREQLPAMASLLEGIFSAGEIDAWIFPTMPLAPFSIELEEHIPHNGRQVPLFRTAVRNLQQASLVGMPSISLPIPGQVPVGLCIECLPGRDSLLLDIAERIETLLG